MEPDECTLSLAQLLDLLAALGISYAEAPYLVNRYGHSDYMYDYVERLLR